MKSFILSRPWLMFVLGLMVGLLVFFPTNQLKEKIFATIAKSTGAQLNAESMSFGTGLNLGFSRGGLLALKFSKLRIQRGTTAIECDKATLSPHLLTIVLGKATIGIGCDSVQHGALDARVDVKPFWAPETLSVDSSFKGFHLAALGELLEAYPIRGVLYGDLQVDAMPLSGRALPPLKWKLSMQKVVLPPVSSDFVSLPEIALGTLDTTGSLQNNKLIMRPLTMGSGASPIKTDLEIDLGLNSLMVPQTGEIKGSLTANPAWEAAIKKTFDLALFFGEPDATGLRRFRKPIQGGPFSLLNPPEPYPQQ